MPKNHHSILQDCRVQNSKVAFSRKLRRTMTEAEAKLWAVLRNRQLLNLKFRRQQIIEGFIVDFYCPSVGLVIEVDGGIHETEEQKALDIHRTEVFESRQLSVLRFTNLQVLESVEMVKDRICTYILSPQQPTSPPAPLL